MIRILAVGRLKGCYRELQEEFLKRMRGLVSVTEIRESDRIRESREILKRLQRMEGMKILCDVRGRLVDDRFFDGVISRDAVFIIGGPDGVDESVARSADQVVSLSPLTFNHQLFRIILLEQIYRAYCRARNLPYARH